MEEPYFKSRWSEQQCKTLEAMRLLDIAHNRMAAAERRFCSFDWGKWGEETIELMRSGLHNTLENRQYITQQKQKQGTLKSDEEAAGTEEHDHQVSAYEESTAEFSAEGRKNVDDRNSSTVISVSDAVHDRSLCREQDQRGTTSNGGLSTNVDAPKKGLGGGADRRREEEGGAIILECGGTKKRNDATMLEGNGHHAAAVVVNGRLPWEGWCLKMGVG